MDKITTIASKTRTQIIVKKSKFITSVAPVNAVNDAEKFIREVSKEFPDATHNVFAYLVEGEQVLQKFSDDGEPSGTAGRPVLEVIRKSGLSNVAVVVSRYFGGIMLGAGGLVRAYTEAAKTGLEEAGRVTMIPHVKILIECSYEEQKDIRYILGDVDAQIEEINYGERINLTTYVPEGKIEVIRGHLTNINITKETSLRAVGVRD